MSRIAYVNGAYVPLAAASVSIMDRGFQFADSIYEVWAVRGGRIFDAVEHMAHDPPLHIEQFRSGIVDVTDLILAGLDYEVLVVRALIPLNVVR